MAYIIILLLLISNILLLYYLIKNPISNKVEQKIQSNIQLMSTLQKEIGNLQNQNMKSISSSLNSSLLQLEYRFQTLELTTEEKLNALRQMIENRLFLIQEENTKKLDHIRFTVDQRLQSSLDQNFNQSFQIVNERLESLYKGLGEIQNLVSGVDDLKKVLSNVKTRGILGEIQLESILNEILIKDQYVINCSPIPTRNVVVEFAIKLPGENNEQIYLPIDSKFPCDAYYKLQDAYDLNDKELITKSQNELIQRIKGFAREIQKKYIEPPYTTDFAIMFLPFEGLYADTIKLGLLETIQRDYHVCIAGPSTMAALLNSLQMGFKTLALQHHSSEVWKLLGSVKYEFEKFNDVLVTTQQRIDQANRELDKLVGVRSRAIQRKLKDIEKNKDYSIVEKEM